MGKGVSILQTVVTNFFRRSLGRQYRDLVDEVNKFQVFVLFSLPPFFVISRQFKRGIKAIFDPLIAG